MNINVLDVKRNMLYRGVEFSEELNDLFKTLNGSNGFEIKISVKKDIVITLTKVNGIIYFIGKRDKDTVFTGAFAFTLDDILAITNGMREQGIDDETVDCIEFMPNNTVICTSLLDKEETREIMELLCQADPIIR